MGVSIIDTEEGRVGGVRGRGGFVVLRFRLMSQSSPILLGYDTTESVR